MGCGKTTLGRAVAHRLSWEFVDLDEYIERLEGMTVRQIFETRGEPYFRQLERSVLGDLSGRDDVIVATGGGTPCQPGMMDLMLSTGIVVFLNVGEERLFERLTIARATRPLIAKLADDELRKFISRNLSQRLEHYTRATVTFDSSRLENSDQIESTTTEFVDLMGL